MLDGQMIKCCGPPACETFVQRWVGWYREDGWGGIAPPPRLAPSRVALHFKTLDNGLAELYSAGRNAMRSILLVGW